MKYDSSTLQNWKMLQEFVITLRRRNKCDLLYHFTEDIHQYMQWLVSGLLIKLTD